MNETLQAIAKRFSCRSFTNQMPTDEQLSAIANAAIQSPSGLNRQPWQVIVLKDQALMRDIEQEALAALASLEDKSAFDRIQERGGTVFYHAPCMIVIPVDENYQDSDLNCGIVCQTIALAAASLGLGSLICGLSELAFNGARTAEFEERLGFLPEYRIGICVLLGYPEQEMAPHQPDTGKISFV